MFTYAEYLKENNNNEIPKYYTDWKLLGPDTTPSPAVANSSSMTGVGIIVSLWIDPQNYNIIFAGSNSGGLYKTTDGGENWIRKINGLPSVFGVNDIVVDPNNKNIMYICTGFAQGTLLTEYGYGIWKSIDGGENWQPTALNFAPTPSEGIIVHRMVINPVNPNIIYAVGKNKFFKTTDGFETYQMTSFENAEFLDINLRPNYPNTIFISGSRLFRSTDGGNTWNSLSFNVSNIPTNQFERIKVAFQENNPDYLLCMFKIPDPVLVCKILSVKSIDGGFTFTDVNNQGIGPWPGTGWNLNPGYWKFELCISPNNINTAYIGGVDLYKTTDGGNSVINISDNIHDDVRVLKVLNDNGNDLLFIGHDGGVAKSLNGNNNNINISGKGLAVNQFYGLGIQQNTSGMIYGGTQDCSIHFYKDNKWYNASFGDGGDCYVDPTNNKRIIGNMNGWPTLSESGMEFTETKVTKSMPRFDAPIIAQPNTINILFGGFLDSIFYTPNACDWKTWRFKSKLPAGSSGIRTMAFDPKNPNILYVGSPNPTWDPNVQAKKFWKSIDGGTTWIDFSTNIPALQYTGISSIAVDPVNTNIIYLSFTNFSTYRVMQSTDGGINWINFSEGLPCFPVNKIKFNENTHDLFAATDVGMFYYDSNIQKWMAINQNTTPTIITDFEFKYNENRLFISTYGAGIWYTKLDTLPIQPPSLLVISRDTIIGNGYYEKGIKITNKAKLTLSENHHFAENTGIVVEAGAKLILDHAYLTNDGINGNHWEGITVLGNSFQPSLFNKQGQISMNYSTIENAVCAIKTVTHIPNTNYNNCTGGIISAANSNFINNLSTIVMAPYNFDYVSSCGFKNCKFIHKGDYKFADLPKFFINLNGVKTISILGNQFTGYQNYDTLNGISSGINCINSQIIVDEYKNNGQIISTNVFKNLCRGIKATTTIPGYTITINKAIFDGTSNVVLPIYISGYTNAIITSNNISVTQKKDNFVPYGIYLDNCTGYHFEDNTFNGGSVRYNHVGLVINNSGNDMNYIYRNKFDKITYAIIAQGNNRGNDIYTGLKIKCNNMGFNYTTWGSHSYMISVTNAHDPQGISVNQGSDYDRKAPAGNLFYHHTKTISEYFNMGNHINYFHHDSVSNPYVKPQKISGDITNINVIYPYTTDCCPSTLDTGNNGGGNATDYINTMNNELDAAHDGIVQLQQLKDGGNTEILKTEVELANSWQALQLRDELLNQSPFVTDTVLGSAIQNENALPNALLRQVLVANPHAAKNNTLMQQLDERNNPMPDYMIADIETGKTKVSAKEIMEANISEHLYKSAFAKNKLKAHFLNDTTDTTSHTAYRLLLTHCNKRNDKYELAYDYLKTGDINNGEITMTEAASDDMDDEENEEYLDNQLLFDIYKRLVSEDKWLTEVEEREITTIRNLAAKDKYMVHAWAKNWLQLVDQDYEYLEPVILPTNGANQRINTATKNTKIANVLIKLQAQPNPAKDYMIVQYEMADADGLLEIRDAKGTIQYSQVLKSTKDQMVIETKSWKSGMYVCSLKSNTTLLKSIVIHIVK